MSKKKVRGYERLILIKVGNMKEGIIPTKKELEECRKTFEGFNPPNGQVVVVPDLYSVEIIN